MFGLGVFGGVADGEAQHVEFGHVGAVEGAADGAFVHDVDAVGDGDDFFHVARNHQNSDAVVVFGPRAGSKTRDFSIPTDLPPGPLRPWLPIAVTQVGSIPPELTYAVTGELSGSIERWREWIEGSGDALASFPDGAPAVLRFDRSFYVAGWPDATLRSAIIRRAAEAVGLPTLDLPDAIRIRRRGALTFAFNYGDEPWTVPARGPVEWLVGSAEIGPQSLACWR